MAEYRAPVGMELWRAQPVPTTPWKLYDLDGPNVEGKLRTYLFLVVGGAISGKFVLRIRGALSKRFFTYAIVSSFVFNLVYYRDKTILL
jgi:hypothetical protein